MILPLCRVFLVPVNHFFFFVSGFCVWYYSVHYHTASVQYFGNRVKLMNNEKKMFADGLKIVRQRLTTTLNEWMKLGRTGVVLYCHLYFFIFHFWTFALQYLAWCDMPGVLAFVFGTFLEHGSIINRALPFPQSICEFFFSVLILMGKKSFLRTQCLNGI